MQIADLLFAAEQYQAAWLHSPTGVYFLLLLFENAAHFVKM